MKTRMKTTPEKSVRIPARAIRVGDKLVRKSDGFLFEVEVIETQGKTLVFRCAGIPPVKKSPDALVPVMMHSTAPVSAARVREGNVGDPGESSHALQLALNDPNSDGTAGFE